MTALYDDQLFVDNLCQMAGIDDYRLLDGLNRSLGDTTKLHYGPDPVAADMSTPLSTQVLAYQVYDSRIKHLLALVNSLPRETVVDLLFPRTHKEKEIVDLVKYLRSKYLPN